MACNTLRLSFIVFSSNVYVDGPVRLGLVHRPMNFEKNEKKNYSRNEREIKTRYYRIWTVFFSRIVPCLSTADDRRRAEVQVIAARKFVWEGPYYDLFILLKWLLGTYIYTTRSIYNIKSVHKLLR